MSQIVCRDLSLGYEGRTVSEHIHFSIETGDYLCIVGENGSGKSTLMRALLGLKSPEGGEIGIAADCAVDYHADARGTAVNYAAVSEAVSTVRNHRKLTAVWKESVERDHKSRRSER
jgi:ABC-type cobalamin/Fe3+-siderophores transport system ATPase subunit